MLQDLLKKEDLRKMNFYEAVKKLIGELKKAGYMVLEDMGVYQGMPQSLIVIKEFKEFKEEKCLKEDFYKIAYEVRLPWFKSGKAYIESV